MAPPEGNSKISSKRPLEQYRGHCRLGTRSLIINDDALAYYDGTSDFRAFRDHDRAHNYGWGAQLCDLGKNQVQGSLTSIKFWIDFYHLDGIR